MVTGPGTWLEQLIDEFNDFLPMYGMLPPLSVAEVERFVALSEQGRELFRTGDLEGAEKAFRGQLAIYAGNHEPFLGLALLEASRDAGKPALSHLRAAVLRGFTDMRRVEKAEAWIRLRKHPGFLTLVDAIPYLVKVERKWPDWDLFQASRPPSSFESIRLKHEELSSLVADSSPVLGPIQAARWNRLFDRVIAAMLEAYVAQNREALDFGQALERLMTLYADGPLHRWELLSRKSAERLGKVCDLMLQHAPDSSMRPVALVGLALVRNSDRDKKGRLRASSGEEIRTYLGEVMSLHFRSTVLPTAAVGLVRTELDLGRQDAAAARYLQFRREHAGDTTWLHRVREELGEWALRLGGLPEFSAASLAGETISSESLGGRVTVIDFWATWCQPCVEEFDTMRRIDDRHGADVTLLGVNLDSSEELSADDLRAWIAQRELRGEQLHDGRSWESEMVSSFGVKEIPFSVVVAPDGSVLAVNEHGKRLEKAVKAALAATPEP